MLGILKVFNLSEGVSKKYIIIYIYIRIYIFCFELGFRKNKKFFLRGFDYRYYIMFFGIY